MKLAILTSTGGATFRQALTILRSCGSKVEFVVISDRECPAEKVADDFSLPLVRLTDSNNAALSCKVRRHLDDIGGVDAVVTFFTRLITAELINAYPCVNIHPSLLPAFKGLHAIDDAYAAKVKFLGATLHMVDEEVDHGPILAQIQTPISEGMEFKEVLNVSHFQTVYLLLLLIDFMESGILELGVGSKHVQHGTTKVSASCNPCLKNDDYLKKLVELQTRLGVEII